MAESPYMSHPVYFIVSYLFLSHVLKDLFWERLTLHRVYKAAQSNTANKIWHRAKATWWGRGSVWSSLEVTWGQRVNKEWKSNYTSVVLFSRYKSQPISSDYWTVPSNYFDQKIKNPVSYCLFSVFGTQTAYSSLFYDSNEFWKIMPSCLSGLVHYLPFSDPLNFLKATSVWWVTDHQGESEKYTNVYYTLSSCTAQAGVSVSSYDHRDARCLKLHANTGEQDGVVDEQQTL